MRGDDDLQGRSRELRGRLASGNSSASHSLIATVTTTGFSSGVKCPTPGISISVACREASAIATASAGGDNVFAANDHEHRPVQRIKGRQ